MEYIQLKKRDILCIGVKDESGKPKLDENGKVVCLEFDLEDIETIGNYSKCVFLAEKAATKLKEKYIVIDKQQDSKGKGIMTRKEEEKYNAMKEYFRNVEEAVDLFLGKGGTTKIFGTKRYLSMFDDFAEMMKPILPLLKNSSDDLVNKIKHKYSSEEDVVIKDE